MDKCSQPWCASATGTSIDDSRNLRGAEWDYGGLSGEPKGRSYVNRHRKSVIDDALIEQYDKPIYEEDRIQNE